MKATSTRYRMVWRRAGSERHGQVPTEPSGTAWQEEAVYDLFPMLSAKFG